MRKFCEYVWICMHIQVAAEVKETKQVRANEMNWRNLCTNVASWTNVQHYTFVQSVLEFSRSRQYMNAKVRLVTLNHSRATRGNVQRTPSLLEPWSCFRSSRVKASVWVHPLFHDPLWFSESSGNPRFQQICTSHDKECSYIIFETVVTTTTPSKQHWRKEIWHGIQ